MQECGGWVSTQPDLQDIQKTRFGSRSIVCPSCNRALCWSHIMFPGNFTFTLCISHTHIQQSWNHKCLCNYNRTKHTYINMWLSVNIIPSVIRHSLMKVSQSAFGKLLLPIPWVLARLSYFLILYACPTLLENCSILLAQIKNNNNNSSRIRLSYKTLIMYANWKR